MEIEGIEKIREHTIEEIKEKVRRNPKFLSHANKERLEYQEKLKFANGYEFTCWMQQNGVMKNPTDVRREEIKKAINGVGCKIPKKCCKCGNIYTYIRPSGYEQWYNCKCGKKDCTGNLCKNCYRYHVDKADTREYLLGKRKNRKCCICGRYEEDIESSERSHWYKHKCAKKDCTKFLCKDCWGKCYIRLPDGVLVANSQWRKGQFSIYKNNGKGIIGEAVIAKVRKLEIISIKLDSLRSKFDLSYDSEYGMIQSKLCSLLGGKWSTKFGMEHNFDIVFMICISPDGENIDRLYIIPERELYGSQNLNIYENSSKGIPWYERYRADQTLYNEAYRSLMSRLEGKKFFSVEDIKEWLVG